MTAMTHLRKKLGIIFCQLLCRGIEAIKCMKIDKSHFYLFIISNDKIMHISCHLFFQKLKNRRKKTLSTISRDICKFEEK